MASWRSMDYEPSPIPYRHAAREREVLREEQERDLDERLAEWEAEDAITNYATEGGIGG